MLDRPHRQTFWKLWKADSTYRYFKKREGELRPISKKTGFQTKEPASLAVTGSKSKTLVADKFLDYPNHVLIRRNLNFNSKLNRAILLYP